MNVSSLLTLTKPELEHCMSGKSRISTYLADIVLDAFGDPQRAAMMPVMMRRQYLRHRDDQDEAYLMQFPTSHTAWSRIIWDVSVIAYLKNPGWTPSLLMPSPILQDDLYWAPQDSGRHAIRIVNYCYRDLIFGDMFACLNYD